MPSHGMNLCHRMYNMHGLIPRISWYGNISWILYGKKVLPPPGHFSPTLSLLAPISFIMHLSLLPSLHSTSACDLTLYKFLHGELSRTQSYKRKLLVLHSPKSIAWFIITVIKLNCVWSFIFHMSYLHKCIRFHIATQGASYKLDCENVQQFLLAVLHTSVVVHCSNW